MSARISKGTLTLLIVAGAVQWLLMLAGAVGLWWWLTPRTCCAPPPTAEQQPPEAFSIYTGLGITKQQAAQRPLGVMIADDPITRPQSGLGLADVVFEMEAAPGITRMLALFQSVLPREIGSVRSVRNDYIDLSIGLDAPIVHWGGEKKALDRLAANPDVNNIDQFANGDLFFRKPGIPAPHDGFTTGELMQQALARFKYARAPKFSAWTFRDEAPASERPTGGTLAIPYNNAQFDVEYRYDPVSNTYFRSQGGAAHKDALTGRQIAPKNVLVVRASHFVYAAHGGYEQFDFTNGGACTLYQDGTEVPCTWKKGSAGSPLVAVGVDGKALPLVRGQTWIEVVPPEAGVIWKVGTAAIPSTP